MNDMCGNVASCSLTSLLEKWEVSLMWVQWLGKKNRIEGVGYNWGGSKCFKQDVQKKKIKKKYRFLKCEVL